MRIHSLPETRLRRDVDALMHRFWAMAWHEDRTVSPGMPDLHFVMQGEEGEKFQCGWLELKAIDKPISPTNRIGVKPSQHQFNRGWAHIMPIYFLVAVQDRCFVIPGKWSRELAHADCIVDLLGMSVLDFSKSKMQDVLPPFLREVTRI